MALLLQKLVIPIFGHCNLSIPLLKHLLNIHQTVEALSRLNQHSLIFHTLLIQKLHFDPIALQVTLTFTCGMEFQYLDNQFTANMQGCSNSARLQTLFTKCHNLVTTLSQPYKVAVRLPQPTASNFHMDDCFIFICLAMQLYGTYMITHNYHTYLWKTSKLYCIAPF